MAQTEKQHRTFQARLADVAVETSAALNAYAELYGRVERMLYAETIAKGIRPEAVKAAYLKRFEITARQFNAICRNLKGKVKSIKELQKDYLSDGAQRIKKAQAFVDRLERKIARAPEAVDRKRWKAILHQKKRRLEILKTRQTRREADYSTGNIRLCFGSKKLFRSQFNLEKSGFLSHGDWHRAWKEKRSSQFYVLGSKDETGGCQGCVATVSDDVFTLKLRLPDAISAQFGKYVSHSIRLPYGCEDLKTALKDGVAINYRFLRDEKGWRVFVTTAVVSGDVKTKAESGAIGVDINADHLALCEVDRFGNPIKNSKIPLCTYGKSTEQAKAIIGDAIKVVVEMAEESRKPIVVEKLDFSKKKPALGAEYSRYARMLSSFSYNKILSTIDSRAYDKGIKVSAVNPAYTSVIGKAKFARRYGISVHQAAACAIARRGLSFSEKPNRRDQLAALLPARNRNAHVWSYWRKVSRILAGHEARHVLGLAQS